MNPIIQRALINVAVTNVSDASVLDQEIGRLEKTITAMIQMNNERLEQEKCEHDLHGADVTVCSKCYWVDMEELRKWTWYV